MFKKQVEKRLSKYKLRLSLISIFLIYLKKITSKVKTVFTTIHSNFLNNKLFSNHNRLLEDK